MSFTPSACQRYQKVTLVNVRSLLQEIIAPFLAQNLGHGLAELSSLAVILGKITDGQVYFLLHACVQQFRGMDMRQRLECMFNGVRETYDGAREGVKTNYYGTKHVIEALLPLLQASTDGRIVNVSSEFGLLRVIVSLYSATLLI